MNEVYRAMAAASSDTSAATRLSLAEQRYWYAGANERPEGDSVARIAFLLHGPLDLERLNSCLKEIVSRHEILRTVYTRREDGIVTPRVTPIPERVLRLSRGSGAAPGDLQCDAGYAAVKSVATRPFDLLREWPCRFNLVSYGLERYVLILQFSHIAFDGTSLGIFLRELNRLYVAPTEDLVARALPPLPCQYRDAASEEADRTTEAILEETEEWWRNHLVAADFSVALTDAERPAEHTGLGSVSPFALPEQVAHRLRELGIAHGSSPFMICLAALQVWTFLRSSSRSFIVGASGSNRDPTTSELIGYFTNALLLRAECRDNQSFASLVEEARDEVLAAMEHGHYRLERVIDLLGVRTDPSRHPFAQVTLAVSAPWDEFLEGFSLGPGLTVDVCDDPIVGTRFDAGVDMIVSDDGCRGHVLYYPALFDTDQGRQLGPSFALLLEELVAKPSVTIGEYRTLASGRVF